MKLSHSSTPLMVYASGVGERKSLSYQHGQEGKRKARGARHVTVAVRSVENCSISGRRASRGQLGRAQQ